ncbi:MAG: glycosyltransferase family 9 protein [Pirellulales bacterium]|nr:glycosyltransferase family 9 protein [Pirellulales bacterium]
MSAADRVIPWPELRRIVVLRALYLGDMLCALPALRALRAAAPGAHIALATMPWARDFVERYTAYVDEFLAFPGFPGLAEQPAEAPEVIAFFRSVQRRQFDLAIQLHGSGTQSNVAIALFGANRTAGFFLPGGYCPDPISFLPYPAHGSEICRNLQLLAHLGATPRGEHLEIPIQLQDQERLQTLLACSPARHEPYVCLHAGAKWASRRWPVEKFAAVGQGLAAQGYHLVLTGSAAETLLVERLSELLSAPHTNICGRTDLGALAAVVRGARLLVTNDTGLSHVAAATGTPSVIIALGSDLDRWRPLDAARHRLVADRCECRPSAAPHCPFGLPCADRITPAAVLACARDLLAAYGGPRLDRSAVAPVGFDQRGACLCAG